MKEVTDGTRSLETVVKDFLEIGFRNYSISEEDLRKAVVEMDKTFVNIPESFLADVLIKNTEISNFPWKVTRLENGLLHFVWKTSQPQ